jgi:hypothetical protein
MMRKLLVVALTLSLVAACGGSDPAETPATEMSSTVAPVETDAVESTIAPTTTQTPSTTSTTVAPTTTVTTVAPATTVLVPDVVAESLERLTALMVADPDPTRRPYDRDAYQPGGWADFNGDCITTRHDVLIRDSQIPVTFDPTGCRVETGQWIDAFTTDLLETADEATIDHHVPLAEAHRAGAWQWDNDTKIRFANDETVGRSRSLEVP